MPHLGYEARRSGSFPNNFDHLAIFNVRRSVDTRAFQLPASIKKMAAGAGNRTHFLVQSTRKCTYSAPTGPTRRFFTGTDAGQALGHLTKTGVKGLTAVSHNSRKAFIMSRNELK